MSLKSNLQWSIVIRLFYACCFALVSYDGKLMAIGGGRLFAQNSIRLTDVTDRTGIQFRHTDGSCGKYYIVEAMSAGLALFDYDGDGDVDIYFLNGADQCHQPKLAGPPTNRLYRNDGQWRFTDVSESAGVDDRSHALGVAVGDYDNDSDLDLYLNNFGPNVLFRNNGDGTFSDSTKEAGLVNGNRVGAGACFLDLENDGDLDLYVGNYIKFQHRDHVARSKRGYPIYGGPSDYPADSDTVYRNNGDGTFADVTESMGIAQHAAPSMGMVAADYDQDGDSDIFVANDGVANYLFENDGHGRFTEVGLLRGFAYDSSGRVHASMGVDCADFDNDGWLDFHVTSYQAELATLYKNHQGTLLDDITMSSRAGIGTRTPVTWGNGFADFDNDGFRDLMIACGHLYDNVKHFDQSTTYHAKNVLLRNAGDGTFHNVSKDAGNGLRAEWSSRGAAFDDLDNDGDLDAVILNSRQRPTLLRNDTQNTNHWLQVQLIGVSANRDAVGSRIEVTAGGRTWVDEVHSGRGYQGHHGSRIHFGLGNATHVEHIKVLWPGGSVTTRRGIATDRCITIVQGDPGTD